MVQPDRTVRLVGEESLGREGLLQVCDEVVVPAVRPRYEGEHHLTKEIRDGFLGTRVSPRSVWEVVGRVTTHESCYLPSA